MGKRCYSPEDTEAIFWRHYAARSPYREALLASDKAFRAWRANIEGGARRGRPLEVGADEEPLAFMRAIHIRTGISSASKLARIVIALQGPPKGGTTASRVDRLARKYRREREFNAWWLRLFLQEHPGDQSFFAFITELGKRI